MAQRPGPSRNRRYPVAYQLNPEQPHPLDSIQLQDANGIIVENLLKKMCHEIGRYRRKNPTSNRNKKNLAMKMIGCEFKELSDRIRGLRPKERSDHALFQVYDWLHLGRRDQDAVLAGRTPGGYFQKYVKREKEDVLAAFPDVQNLALTEYTGKLIVPNVLRRLDFELQYNEWTMSQFAFRVFGQVGAGPTMLRIMDYPGSGFGEWVYQTISNWLDLTEADRLKVMNGGLHVPKTVAPLPYRYLANPDDFEIRDADFRRCMQTEVKRQLRALQAQKNQQPANQTITGKITEYSDVWEFLTGRSNDEPSQQSLMSLAFMNGVEIDHVQLAKCIKYVLEAHDQKHEDFAEIVLKCRPDIFDRLITSPASHCSERRDQYLFTKISGYLMKNYEERKAAWLQDFRAAHLSFVANPCIDTFNVRGFRQRLRWLAQEQVTQLLTRVVSSVY